MCKWGTTITMPVEVWVNFPEEPEKYELKEREIDACLAPHIWKLNNNQVRTLNCCCSHRQDWRFNRDQIMEKYRHAGILIDNNCARHAEALGYQVNITDKMTEITIPYED